MPALTPWDNLHFLSKHAADMQPSDYSHNDHGDGRQSGRCFHHCYHYQDGCGNSFNGTAEYANRPYLGRSCASFCGSTLPFRHGSWGRGAPFRGHGASSFPYRPPREFRGRPFCSRAPRGRPPHSLRLQEFDSPYPYFKQTRHRDSSDRLDSSPCYKDYSDGAQMGLYPSSQAGGSKLTSQSHARGMLVHHDENLAHLERNISPAGPEYSPSRPRERVMGNPKRASPTPTKRHSNENESLARQIEVHVSRNAAKAHVQGDLTSKHVSPNRARTPDCSTAKMQLTSRTVVKSEGKSDDLMNSDSKMQSPSKITTSTSCKGRTKGPLPAPIKRNRHASSPCKLKSVGHAQRKKSVVSSLTVDSTGTVEQTKGKQKTHLSSPDMSSGKLKSATHALRKKRVVSLLTVDGRETVEHIKGEKGTCLSSTNSLSMPNPEHNEKLNSCIKSTSVNMSTNDQRFNKKRCSKHQLGTTPYGKQPPEDPVGTGRHNADSTPPPSPKQFHRKSAADITSSSVTALPPSRVVMSPSDKTGGTVPPESSSASLTGSTAHNVSTESIDGDALGKSLHNSVDLWAAGASTFPNDLHKIPICTLDQIDETTEAHIAREQPGQYLERVKLFFEANSFPEEKKKSVFLACCGASTYSLLRSLLIPRTSAHRRHLCRPHQPLRAEAICSATLHIQQPLPPSGGGCQRVRSGLEEA
ncbi:hypothetical protein HPB50_012751 [Hyalomma asiaticum]|uniref:Uncharacterized protein n=1 Tax=Hyalomma asiaticum TaxID=266040 RepID=A0ACB7TFJ8_HYAAI|nr:hypothetical protein HPB50_012751 [Hyalomma asiaticum]